jgi:folate-binding protein YgfZ
MTPDSLPPEGTDAKDAGRRQHWSVARIDTLGVLCAQGRDAATFLHGQFTQDVSGLSPGTARLAGYCSAKGRLLATFLLLRPAPDTVLALCSADVLAPTLKRLSMFVLRAQCKLTDASAEWSLWGTRGARLVGQPANAGAWTVSPLPAPDEGWTVAVPSADGVPRSLVLAAPGERPAALAGAAEATSEDWAWDDIHAGLPRVTAATVEQFVPQMVNLELVGGVNFQKGCYPGQEVVARSQYRGTLKRRMALFTTSAPVSAGVELFHDSDTAQPSGLVVNAARRASRTALLAEVKLAALAAPGAWHLGSPAGPVLDRGTLPYAWPAEHDGSPAAA